MLCLQDSLFVHTLIIPLTDFSQLYNAKEISNYFIITYACEYE